MVTTTRRGREKSEMIKLNRGLPQGDALCPRLFTLCMNPIAWKVRATGRVHAIKTDKHQSYRPVIYG